MIATVTITQLKIQYQYKLLEIVGTFKRLYLTMSREKNCEQIPEDIDDTCVYIGPLKKGILNYFKGKRPWGHAHSSKIINFSVGPKFLFNGWGSYLHKNPVCKNIIDLGVNYCDFECLNDQMICTLCGKEALFIPCGTRPILEEDLVNKI